MTFGADLLFDYGGKKQQFHKLTLRKQRYTSPEIAICIDKLGECRYTVNLPFYKP